MKKMNEKTWNRILLIIPVVFYLAFWIIDGAIWCADTASYVEMHRSREPLYPLYLLLFRSIFGSTAIAPLHGDQLLYLFAAVLGQSLLAAYATYNVCKFITYKFNLNRLTSLVILSLPMATSLLCRFAAARAAMYTNSILTESLAVSIYLLFVRYCLEYISDCTKKSMVACVILCIIGILLRKQMNILLVLFAIAIIYTTIVNKSRRSILAVFLIILVLAVTKLFDCTYNEVKFHEFSGHTEDNRFITTMALYVADREDVQYVIPELRDLYLEIYDICDNEGWLMHDAPANWLEAEEHFAGNYDHIQLDTMGTIIDREVENNDYSWLGVGDQKDLIRKSFNKSLLTLHVDRLIKVFINNYIAGLITSIAVKRPILNLYSAVMYLVYFAILIILLMKMLKHRECFRYHDAFLMGLLVLVSIFCNVALVAAVIFTQTRYTIYNMPLFYMALVVMGTVLIEGRKTECVE